MFYIVGLLFDEIRIKYIFFLVGNLNFEFKKKIILLTDRKKMKKKKRRDQIVTHDPLGFANWTSSLLLDQPTTIFQMSGRRK